MRPTNDKPGKAGIDHRLLERDWEVTTIKQSLQAAKRGAGSVVFIEAPGGRGKTSLLRATRVLAQQANMSILVANCSHLEQDFAFGVALQLLEPLWLASTPGQREQMLAGPAQLAATLLREHKGNQRSNSVQASYPLVHALFWAIRNIVASHLYDGAASGLTMLVDNVHFADVPSLRVLAYLGERIVDLPISIVTAAMPGERASDGRAIATRRRAGRDTLLRPAPLSSEGVDKVVRGQYPRAGRAFCAACSEVTGGNPFLLVELLDKLRQDEKPPTNESAIGLAELVPGRVREAVSSSLERMPSSMRLVAKAALVFGERTTVTQAARLAELDAGDVRSAADGLAAMEILRPGTPLTFVHPLVRSALRSLLPTLELTQAHLRAVHILADEQADSDEIASHLLRAPPDDDPTAIAPLRAAAAQALENGELEHAVRLLERALEERPSSELKVELLVELAHAEDQLDLPNASERLREARSISKRPERRAELALAQAQALYRRGRYRDAAGALEAELSEIGGKDEQLTRELRAAYVSSASLVEELRSKALRMGSELPEIGSAAPTAVERAAMAHTVVHDSLSGMPREVVRERVDSAWDEGALLQSKPGDWPGWPLLWAALIIADELERATELCEVVLGPEPNTAGPVAQQTFACARAWILYEQGRLTEAEANANAALAEQSRMHDSYTQVALTVVVCCHIERGQLAQAQESLRTLERLDAGEPILQALLFEVRGRLRLAEHRPKEALTEAMQAGRVLEAISTDVSPGAIPWRSTAALAHIALGETEQAQALVEEELARARAAGVTRTVIRDLRILGLAMGGAKGIAKFYQAAKLGESYPSRLEYIRSLIDLGSALRRANRRAEARDPLRKGLHSSHKGGASALAERAQRELLASGARPRRAAYSGVESLTPSQMRVAELAAEGLTTRQIAERLFVTPKTVEAHLWQIYRKLNVGSRAELAVALQS